MTGFKISLKSGGAYVIPNLPSAKLIGVSLSANVMWNFCRILANKMKISVLASVSPGQCLRPVTQPHKILVAVFQTELCCQSPVEKTRKFSFFWKAPSSLRNRSGRKECASFHCDSCRLIAKKCSNTHVPLGIKYPYSKIQSQSI